MATIYLQCNTFKYSVPFSNAKFFLKCKCKFKCSVPFSKIHSNVYFRSVAMTGRGADINLVEIHKEMSGLYNY